MSFEFRRKTSGSNSKQIGEELGKQVAEGMGIGLDDSSYYAITAMENVYVELETLTKNAAKNAEKLAKKRQERQLDNLKNALDLQMICEQEYYEKLKQFRDENLRYGTDAWYKCTEEIAAYNQRLVEETQKQYETVLKLRDELGKKLEGNEPWATHGVVKFVGLGQNGTDLVYSNAQLKNFNKEISLLERYRNVMNELRNLGTVPEGIFEDIGKLDVQEGLNAARAILSLDDRARAEFFSGYKKHEDLSIAVASEMVGLFNSRELESKGISLNGAVKERQSGEKFAEILRESFAEVPESYVSLGNQAGEAFGRGFLEKIPAVMENTREYFLSSINELAAKLSASIKESVAASVQSVSNTYQTTYTFNSSRDTTTQQLNAASNAAALSRLRGGN